MDVKDIKIKVFPGRLLVEREPIHTGIINPKGLQRRKNKGIVLDCSEESRFKKGDDVFFMARRGTLIGDNALIDENDVILLNMKQLLGDRVLIEPIEEKKVTEGGIVIPDTVKDLPQRGYARAIGDEMPLAKEGERKGSIKYS